MCKKLDYWYYTVRAVNKGICLFRPQPVSESVSKKVLLLGSGYVSAPVVDYLTSDGDYQVKVCMNEDANQGTARRRKREIMINATGQIYL